MFLFGYSGPLHADLESPIDCELPVFDLTSKKSAITGSSGKPRARVRPLPPSQTLTFNVWKLAHAVKKAECTIPLLPGVANVSALGFVLEHAHLFHWPTSVENFRLEDAAIGVLDDFSQSGFAGRLGQGFCLLFMESQGYKFATRFQTCCAASVPKILTRHRVKKKNGKLVTVQLPTPDFVCEMQTGHRAIAESKGGFVSAAQTADIKGALREGLKQIGTWGTKFSPAITRNYAVSTFLRERSDPHAEPSLVAWADPEGREGDHRLPEEFVWRANYAAWLRGMGYDQVASRVQDGQEWSATYFRGADIGGVKVVFSAMGVYAAGESKEYGAVAAGLRLDVLQALREGRKPSALNNLPRPDFDGHDELTFGSFLGDGTYLGLVPPPSKIFEITL